MSEPDGILAPADPVQTNIEIGESVTMNKWTLRVRAHYMISARVLGVERYHLDALSNLAPEDLALGWGPMSDNRVLRTIDVSQSNRFYYWRLLAGAPIPRQDVITHSANTHVIPADVLIARELSQLRRGEIVTLSGDLVDGARGDGASVHTSLVRTDTGAGACEIMLVREVSVRRGYP